MKPPHKRTGKTTRLFEEVVKLLGELPEGEYVFVTCPHVRWLRELENEFKRSGLVDVMFFSPSQIGMGALTGRRGVLMIDDFQDMTPMQADAVLEARKYLEYRSSRRP